MSRIIAYERSSRTILALATSTASALHAARLATIEDEIDTTVASEALAHAIINEPEAPVWFVDGRGIARLMGEGVA